MTDDAANHDKEAAVEQGSVSQGTKPQTTKPQSTKPQPAGPEGSPPGQSQSSGPGTKVGGISSSSKILDPFVPRFRIRRRGVVVVEVEEFSKGRWAGWKEKIETIAPLMSLAATVVIAFFVFQLDERQAKANQADLQTKILAELTEKDPDRLTLRAISLARYGEDALPSVRLALGVQSDSIRRGGAIA